MTLPSDWSVMVVLVVKDRNALRGTLVALNPNLDNMVKRLNGLRFFAQWYLVDIIVQDTTWAGWMSWRMVDVDRWRLPIMD